MSSAVIDYIQELRQMRHGTAELARYTPLINLLNASTCLTTSAAA